jgi:hypothetical protein
MVLRGRFYRATKVSSQTATRPSQKLLIKRKVLWKHNTIRTNRVNLALLDSKAVNREIARKRNANANSASVKDKAVAANLVGAVNKAAAAVNRVAAVSKADDKPVV